MSASDSNQGGSTQAQLPAENSHQKIPIYIITGFLGSGKTTLLNRLLQQPGMTQTAVIVNEVGEIGIDHLLLESTEDDMLLLAGGCLCCAVRSDLITTLQNLFEKSQQQQDYRFQRVLIETSGLADPAPILRTLINDDFIVAHYRLEQVITTVDAIYGMQQLDEHDESVKQAALANHLLLTKTDHPHSCEEVISELMQRLQQLNPAAYCYDLKQGLPDVKQLFAGNTYDPQTRQLDIQKWLQTEIYAAPFTAHHHQDKQEQGIHDQYIHNFCLKYTQPLPWKVLEHWLQQLTRLRGKDLLRIKGIAWTQETNAPVLIQGVQHILQSPVQLKSWPDSQPMTQIVFITRNLPEDLIRKNLEALLHSPTPAERAKAAMLLL
ncbi:GTP-binding protein [Candidatus Venteria ishoeyi]|uniref:CobW family GTP-binding protein n=1 Tax=Candidatus Venteria ishoeyi TaxID=1899563 RepID=UPI0025A66D1E|nr:GTP-binding protein [Candidatus Venteria ishoeyi]MDM8546914.1 GTP-binding protein [Candidatus Venteria ishoeyi]